MTVRTTSQRTITATIGLTVAAILAQAANAAPASEQASDRKGVGHSVGPQTTTTPFSLPPQSLAQSLRDIGAVTNTNILFDPPLVKGLTAPALKASLTTSEALTRLLAGTEIKYDFMNDSTVVVGANDAKLIRVAQADTTNQNSSMTNSSAEDKSSSTKMEEVVVTAQNREERLQDVPISISVLGGADLDKLTGSGARDILTSVPGVSIIQATLGGGAQIPIRGVAAGATTFAGASPTAYYLDSVPFGFSKTAIGPDPDVYDLERIEVLRGPQGTLYGAGALNGVVRILTRDPDLDELAFKVRASASSTDDGGENYRADMAVNVPIIDGKVAARAAVGYQDLSGWVEKPNQSDANAAERRNMRLRVLAQPTDELSIGLSAWLSRTDYDAPSAANDDGQRLSPQSEPTYTDYDAYGLQLGYEFPRFTVSSATSYLDYVNHWDVDLNPAVGQNYDGKLPAKTFAEEILLSSTQTGVWRWTAGYMYRDSEDSLSYFIEGVGQTVRSVDTRTSKSHAVFGELTRLLFGNQLELTAGLRYFKDKVELREISHPSGLPDSELVKDETTFDATTPRLIANWHPIDGVTVYGSYSEGFRSGAYQGPSVLRAFPDFPQADPDTLKNYELGSKGTFREGRMSYDLAIFYMDWQDVQQQLSVLTPIGLRVAAIVNGDSASGMGFECALQAQPANGLLLGVNLSWNDLTVGNDVRAFPNGGPPDGVILFHKGDRLNWSSEYTAGASAAYEFALGSSGVGVEVMASANFVSGEEHKNMVGVTPVSTQSDDMLIARASASIRSQRGWSATAFVDNLNDERGSPARETTRPDWSARVRPRTVGLQFEYQYR